MNQFMFSLILFSISLLTACDGFWGTETDTSFLDVPLQNTREVAYVPILPVIDNVIEPLDIIAGYDELVYVVDGATDEIISFDQAGNELGRLLIPGVTDITQDRRLELLAIGRKDTIINGTNFNLAAIYRIDLFNGNVYGLNEATIKRISLHPFYFRTATPNEEDTQVSFSGISSLSDNRYYVSRNGPSNIPNKFGGPDDIVLLFDEKDSLISPIFVNTSFGLTRDFFRLPQGITSFAAPPQSPSVNSSGDFLVTSISETNALRVRWVRANIIPDAPVSYELQLLSVGDTARADGFLYAPDRFSAPVDVTVTGDGTNYLFVVDREKDSLYQFTLQGLEGIIPPAGSESNRAIRVSFGGTGASLTQFRQPSGVAYLNEILYVADKGNGRILRFKLTTDFD